MRFCRYADLYCVDAPIGIFRSHLDQVSAASGQQYLLESERFFHSAGGKYMNVAQEWVREKVLRRLATRAKIRGARLYHSAKVVAKKEHDSEWAVESRLMI